MSETMNPGSEAWQLAQGTKENGDPEGYMVDFHLLASVLAAEVEQKKPAGRKKLSKGKPDSKMSKKWTGKFFREQ